MGKRAQRATTNSNNGATLAVGRAAIAATARAYKTKIKNTHNINTKKDTQKPMGKQLRQTTNNNTNNTQKQT